MAGSSQTCDELRKAKVCESIDLYPLMELKRKFLIIKEIDEKIPYASSRGIEGSICPRIHQSEKSFHRARTLFWWTFSFFIAEATRVEALTEKNVSSVGMPDNGQTCSGT